MVVAVVAGVVILGVVAVGADAVDDRARRGRQAAGGRGRRRGAVLHHDVATARKEIEEGKVSRVNGRLGQ